LIVYDYGVRFRKVPKRDNGSISRGTIRISPEIWRLREKERIFDDLYLEIELGLSYKARESSRGGIVESLTL
jgi:hypothetical protein